MKVCWWNKFVFWISFIGIVLICDSLQSIVSTYAFSKHRQGKRLQTVKPLRIAKTNNSIHCISICLREEKRKDSDGRKCVAVNFSSKNDACELLPERICDNEKNSFTDDEAFMYFDVEPDTGQELYWETQPCKDEGKCSGTCQKTTTTEESTTTTAMSTSSTSSKPTTETSKATTTSSTALTSTDQTSTTTTSTTASTTSTTPESTTTSTSSTSTTPITTTSTSSTSTTPETTTTSTDTTTTTSTTSSTSSTSTSTLPSTTSTLITTTTEQPPKCPDGYYGIPIIKICLKFIPFTTDDANECGKDGANAFVYETTQQLFDLLNGLTQAFATQPKIQDFKIYVPVFFKDYSPPKPSQWEFLSLNLVHHKDFWAIAADGSVPDYLNPGGLHCSKLFFFQGTSFLLSPIDCGQKTTLSTMCVKKP